MLNRVMQIRFVRPRNARTDTDNPTETLNARTVTIVAATAEKVVRKVAMAALGYVVLDTARQVMVAHASNPNP